MAHYLVVYNSSYLSTDSNSSLRTHLRVYSSAGRAWTMLTTVHNINAILLCYLFWVIPLLRNTVQTIICNGNTFERYGLSTQLSFYRWSRFFLNIDHFETGWWTSYWKLNQALKNALLNSAVWENIILMPVSPKMGYWIQINLSYTNTYQEDIVFMFFL